MTSIDDKCSWKKLYEDNGTTFQDVKVKSDNPKLYECVMCEDYKHDTKCKTYHSKYSSLKKKGLL